jgi:hypothetical protein
MGGKSSPLGAMSSRSTSWDWVREPLAITQRIVAPVATQPRQRPARDTPATPASVPAGVSRRREASLNCMPFADAVFVSSWVKLPAGS